MTSLLKGERLYDDLRATIKIPGTSIDKLRDLTYYGSGDPRRWKSGYKKDYPHHQPSDLITPDPLGLRQTGEVILKYENLPAGISETRNRHTPILMERPEREFHWSKSRGFNREFLGGDPRLTCFDNTSSKADHCAYPVTTRQPVDKIRRIEQSYNVPVGDPKMNNQHIRAKNREEYPRYGVVERTPSSYHDSQPSEISHVLKDVYHDKFADGSDTTTHSTYQAFSDNDFATKHQYKEIPTPKSVLFTVTSKETPTSEAREEYQPFTRAQIQAVKPINHGGTKLDCRNLFYRDARVLTPQSTSQSVYSTPDASGIPAGKRRAEWTYGDVVGQDMKMEDCFMPKNIHQLSMTRESYPHWGSSAYRPPADSHLSFSSHIPLSMEDGPRSEMITSHQESYVSYPQHKEEIVRHGPGGITTAIPIRAATKPQDWNTEMNDRFKKWSMKGNRLDLKLKDQHVQTMVEAKDVVDFRTTNNLAYWAPGIVKTIPATPIKSHDPILNDANGVGKDSPFELRDVRERYRPPVRNIPS